MNKKKKLNHSDKIALSKRKRQTFELDTKIVDKVKELIPKYQIKSFQTLFEYLIVSGAIYLKRSIIELIRERTKDIKERYKQDGLRKLSGNKEGIRVKRTKINPTMYDRDYEAFARFVIEEKTKKYWVIEILLEEFAKENPIIIDHIKECQKLNVTERKQQIDRITQMEYVFILAPEDANKILDRNTKKFDSFEFKENLLQAEVQNVIRELKTEAQIKEDVDRELAAKIKKISQERRQKIEEISEMPDDDYENQESDTY